MIDRGLIISTEQLTEEPDMRKILERYGDFVMDWKGKYMETAASAWSAIHNKKAIA